MIALSAPPIDLDPHHWEIVREILARHVAQYDVWGFGSRATGRAKKYSNLDLAVITHQPMSLSLMAALNHDFTTSDLPIKIDVVDWSTPSPAFSKIIEAKKVQVQSGKMV